MSYVAVGATPCTNRAGKPCTPEQLAAREANARPTSGGQARLSGRPRTLTPPPPRTEGGDKSEGKGGDDASAPSNMPMYLMLAAGAGVVWFFFLRKK